LGDAWLKGAQELTEAQRMAFANDPLNLQATDGPTDVQKGNSDAADWLPPNKSFHCNYVARQISVKATYELWVTQAEHDAMAHVLADCADQLVPTSEKEVVVAAAAETSKARQKRLRLFRCRLTSLLLQPRRLLLHRHLRRLRRPMFHRHPRLRHMCRRHRRPLQHITPTARR
jgi:hypothetical protein